MINEELLRILEKLQVGDQGLINAHDEVLNLFSVSNSDNVDEEEPCSVCNNTKEYYNETLTSTMDCPYCT